MKGNILLNSLIVFTVFIAIVSMAYFFMTPSTQKTTTNANPALNTVQLGSSSAIGVGLYDINNKLIGVIIDSAQSFALYQVNTVSNVYSLAITGQVCVKSPYKIVIDADSSNAVLKSSIATVTLEHEIGKLPDGRSVADLKANECARFTTAPMILDNLGAGNYQVSFSASGYTTYASGAVSQLIEVANSNVMNLNITMIPSVSVSVNFEPSNQTTTTTTIPAGATTTTIAGATTTTAPSSQNYVLCSSWTGGVCNVNTYQVFISGTSTYSFVCDGTATSCNMYKTGSGTYSNFQSTGQCSTPISPQVLLTSCLGGKTCSWYANTTSICLQGIVYH